MAKVYSNRRSWISWLLGLFLYSYFFLVFIDVVSFAVLVLNRIWLIFEKLKLHLDPLWPITGWTWMHQIPMDWTNLSTWFEPEGPKRTSPSKQTSQNRPNWFSKTDIPELAEGELGRPNPCQPDPVRSGFWPDPDASEPTPRWCHHPASSSDGWHRQVSIRGERRVMEKLKWKGHAHGRAWWSLIRASLRLPFLVQLIPHVQASMCYPKVSREP